jgi:hypothetical protein
MSVDGIPPLMKLPTAHASDGEIADTEVSPLEGPGTVLGTICHVPLHRGDAEAAGPNNRNERVRNA